MSDESTHLFAQGLYRGVLIVTRYMNNRAAMIEGVMPQRSTPHRDQAIHGLWIRSRGWMQTLQLLNQTRHIQAMYAANRTLLEMLVDLILIHHDQTNANGWKYYCWGQSERMKAAEQVVAFYRNKEVPDQYQPLVNAVNTELELINNQRRILWPNRTNPDKADHPKRWTGQSNLFPDIEAADQIYGPTIQNEFGITLTEYYRTEYRRINWLIHSGGAGFWGLPATSFNILAGLALKWSSDFSLLITRLILEDFRLMEVDESLRVEWDTVKSECDRAYADSVFNPSSDS